MKIVRGVGLIGALLISVQAMEAGSGGAAFGGALGGSLLGSAIAGGGRHSETVYVESPRYVETQSSTSSSSSIRTLKREIRDLQEENDELRADIKQLKKKNKELQEQLDALPVSKK